MNKLNMTKVRLYMMAITYVLIAVLLVTSITFAWFTLTNNNKVSLVNQVSGVEAEYDFYVYNDPTHSGSSNLTLINNTTTNDEEYGKYLEILNPTSNILIPGYIAPGEVFSFAIAVQNVGSTNGNVSLSFSQVYSNNYSDADNKIQQAMGYEVTKISYLTEGFETEDYKDINNVDYINSHFSNETLPRYELVNSMSLNYLEYDTVVIYFNIYFDPHVYGTDPYGIPYTNSNIFMGQTFQINTINMVTAPE